MKMPKNMAIDFNVLDLYMEDIITRKGTIFSLVIEVAYYKLFLTSSRDQK